MDTNKNHSHPISKIPNAERLSTRKSDLIGAIFTLKSIHGMKTTDKKFPTTVSDFSGQRSEPEAFSPTSELTDVHQ